MHVELTKSNIILSLFTHTAKVYSSLTLMLQKASNAIEHKPQNPN